MSPLTAMLEELPVPRTEWRAMREIFGDAALADLLGISLSSLKRYAGEVRATPAITAKRLRWLEMVVADLAGSYDKFGIRRWFERPRSELHGRSPRKSPGSHWSPNDPAAQGVRSLATRLAGAATT